MSLVILCGKSDGAWYKWEAANFASVVTFDLVPYNDKNEV